MPVARSARGPRAEDGAGGVLGVVVLAAACGVACAIAPIAGAFGVHQRVVGASDAAALAAADTASGRVAGEPCLHAGAIAEALAVRLVDCSPEADGSVTVTLAAEALGLTLSATSRAGPAP